MPPAISQGRTDTSHQQLICMPAIPLWSTIIFNSSMWSFSSMSCTFPMSKIVCGRLFQGLILEALKFTRQVRATGDLNIAQLSASDIVQE